MLINTNIKHLQAIIILLLACVKLNAGIKDRKDSIVFFKSVEISAGLLNNQANIGPRYYEINKKKAFNFSCAPVSFRNVSFLVSGGYREKGLEGTGNHGFKRLFDKRYFIIPFQYDKVGYNYKFNYITGDLALKSAFLLKYMLQPYIYYGLRYNRIIKYTNNDTTNNVLLDYYILTDNLRKNHFNPFYGLGLYIDLNDGFKVFGQFEINHDKKALNGFEHGLAATNIPPLKEFRALYELRFHTYSYQIGVLYSFKQLYSKIKKREKS